MPKPQLKYHLEVPLEFAGYTVQEFLANQLLQFSAATIKKMLYHHRVKIADTTVKATYELKVGDVIEIKLAPETADQYPTSAPQLPILFENSDFLVADKPAGMPVVAERWNQLNLFKQAILQHLQNTNQTSCEPNLVHRIDKEASGLVILSKNIEMERYLNKLFEQHTITKEYLAIVAGVPPEQGRIELRLKPASRHENRMLINENGKIAITNYKTIERFRDFALLHVNIETGRTHQIRVHLASQGYPLAVDSLYGYRACIKLSDLKPHYRKKGEEKALISRLTLHAWKLSFELPDHQKFQIEAPIPEDMQIILKMLRKYRPAGSLPSTTGSTPSTSEASPSTSEASPNTADS